MFASRLIIASMVVLLVGLYLFQSLWSERVYSWYRQPDEFWFSAVAMTFAVLVGVGMLVWGLAHIRRMNKPQSLTYAGNDNLRNIRQRSVARVRYFIDSSSLALPGAFCRQQRRYGDRQHGSKTGRSPPDRSDLFINHAVKSLTDTLHFLILTFECERIDYPKQAKEQHKTKEKLAHSYLDLCSL